MDLNADLLPAGVPALAWLISSVLLVGVLIETARRGDLPVIASNAFLGAVVALLLLWQLRAVTSEGVALHVLGATLLQLMFGWHIAIVGMAVLIAAHTANGAGDLAAYGMNLLLMGVLPVSVSAGVRINVARRLPGNPFGFILISGFGGGAAAMLSCWLCALVLLLATAGLDADRALDQFGAGGMLLLFPEAFLNGALCACLSMFCPQLVRTWRIP